jgi:hypothetical protein
MNRLLQGALSAVLLAAAVPASTAAFVPRWQDPGGAELPSSGDVTILTGALTGASLPAAFRSAPRTDSYGALVADLRERGTLRLQNAVLTLDGTEPFVISAETLHLVNARVFTGGADVDIHVLSLVTDEASAIATFDGYAPAPPPSAPDRDGAKGAPGRGGGRVRIFVAERVDGVPVIQLAGEVGGRGESGLQGVTGAKGPRGHHARERRGFCRRGPGRGGPGGMGGRGGRAGDGGEGGPGGVLEVVFYNQAPQPEVISGFQALGGPGGPPGLPGPGGLGGPGGDGGPTNNACGGKAGRGEVGPLGPTGAPGRQGGRGREGSGSVRTERLPD